MNLAVVYLNRKGTNTAPFYESYIKFKPKAAHDLLIIAKGYSFNAIVEAPAAAHKIIQCKDVGYDLTAYKRAVDLTNYDQYLFLNSYSIIEHPLWLDRLVDAYTRSRQGIVGCSGSWETFVKDRANTGLKGWVASKMFPGWPNPHIRTNAFLTSRNNLLKYMSDRYYCRLQAYMFESGVCSFTKHIRNDGGESWVVGKNGEFDIWDYEKSNTFRIGAQSNLLISDNRTRQYQCASSEEQAKLTKLTWGK